jgi:hypothetical protein
MLWGRGGHEERNVDGGFLNGMECGEVHCVGWAVAAHDPGLVLLHEKARAMDDANTNVDNVIIGDGMLGKVGKRCSPEQACNKELKPLWWMPFQGHGSVIRCAAVLRDEPGKHLAKNGVGVFHPDLFVWLFEGYQDKVKESVNEGRVHVDDIVTLLECHALGEFDVGMILGVGASTVVGYIHDFRGKWIVRIGVCLATK